MMVALDRHRKYVPESQRYYEKKRSEGKKHNQAIRALGRHLSRIIYKLLKEEREYEIRREKGNTKSKVSPRFQSERCTPVRSSLGFLSPNLFPRCGRFRPR